MTKKSKQEWYDLVMECRRSGLTDRQWCLQQNIPFSTFYYHIRRLRREACELPVSTGASTTPVVQDIVKLSVFEDEPEMISTEGSGQAAISLQLNGVTINIQNQASASVIANTLKALRELC